MNDASDLVLDDRYAIGRRIGAGGAASVYEAIDRRLGKRVAVKVLDHPDGGCGKRRPGRRCAA